MRHTLAKRFVSGISALALATTTSLTAFSGLAAAAANTCTWTGTAGDKKFSTAANWSGCNSTAPQNGDAISFGFTVDTSGGTPLALTNDLPSTVAFSGVTVNTKGTTAGAVTYYSVDKLTLADGATLTGTYGGLTVTDITQTGSLTVSGYMPFWAASHDINLTPTNFTTNEPALCMGGAGAYAINIKPTGVVNVNSGGAYAVMGTESSIVVNSGGLLNVGSDYVGNITFNGGGATQGSNCGTAESLAVYDNAKLSGTITLGGGDIVYDIFNGKTLTITGTIQGPGSALKAIASSAGTFVNNAATNNSATAGGSQVVAAQILPTITDSQPTANLSVESNQIVTLDGVRGYTSVNSKGVLKGTGTVEGLSVYDGGTVAPGHSPGKLTVVKTLSLYAGAIYQAELKTSAAGEYDQIAVGAATDTTGNSVTLGDATNGGPTLDLQLYKGYSIKAGDTFTIIDNQSKTDVKGTFANLPEGATFKGPNGSVFKITYKGGDGNDVVLTVVTAPTTPDTGFAQVAMGNPLVTLAVAVMAAGGILVASRKMGAARR